MIIAVDIVKCGQWDDAIYHENRLCGGQEMTEVIHPVTGEKVRGLRPNYMSNSLPMVFSHTENRGKFTYAFFDVYKEVWEEKFVFPKMKANMWELKEKGLKIHAVLTTRVGNSRPFLEHEWYKMPNHKIEVRWSGNQFVGHIPGPNNIKFYIATEFNWRTDDEKILSFAKEHFGVEGMVRKLFSPTNK